MDITSKELLALATGLLALYNPPLCAFIYAPITGHLPPQIRLWLSLKMFSWISAILVASVWAGQVMLNLMGISSAALIMTGGFLLLITSLPMVLGRESALTVRIECAAGEDGDAGSRENVAHIAVVPLVFPLSIGGATIALIIGTAARFHSAIDLLFISLICILFAAMVGLTHFVAGAVARKVNRQRMEIIKRASGILLVAIAFQLLAQAVRDLLPGLAGRV